ncbi:endopeptidase La [Acidithiobacillus sp. 'AMD consortium']|uniref:Lon protease n=4 Tax=Acidithiobacillaceae TaxID=225058 RepID=A0A8X8GDW2_ACIFI|nr:MULTISPECIES: endopeptidase La [Acidithiobacillus]MBU2714857.1 endopeptidase La [Acidithiobacillus ferridurans]MBU2724096.1 endopeptidase La [Acidithiobacillus ferridurans]MBU2725761.1 endopeptidase La [Acidithiobacillus ferridurans]MBU2805970.1 endopeptidase La [Acidithiobacillus ferridurans]QFG78118.1 endopeptidase La [Acidithiobacillus sp. 'AMD consortium']
MAKIDRSLLVEEEAQMVPVLPLRDVVVFPFMVIPLFVGRAKSIRALEDAMSGEKQILLVSQKNAADDDPQPENIYRIGTLATILQLLKLPDGTVKVLVEGTDRAKIVSFLPAEESLRAQVQIVVSGAANDRELEALMRSVSAQFEAYVKLNKKIPPEILSTLASMDDPARLADTVAAHLGLKLEEKQEILEKADTRARLEHLLGMMESEIDLLQVEKRIRGRVKRQMEKSQREYYLNEQMKAIQKELGDLSEEGGGELDELARKIDKAGMPKDVRTKADAELKKLRMMSPMSAEATVVRNYIDWLVGVPWRKRSKITKDLKRAKAILDADHYGLEDVKERILEYLAVQERVGNSRGPILCLVGPPGVGKTSLGRSIAAATGRKFVRMSLGGVRDEAEIRGHRRTYIGALPGKIVQSLAKIATRNPLMLLDEVDKMAMDFRGDPASALLEVLDPEQNTTFSDHYLEVDFNLSEVMFVTTANTLNIPAPLMDRMEVIRISGYTEDEKIHIATKYLLPKQIEKAGLLDGEMQLSQTVIRDIIRYYTREAGVRNLERELARICRKVVKELLLDKKRTRVQVSDRNLDKYLGVRRFDFGKAEKENRIGEVTGLAWTEVGGELLSIEAVVVPGRGKLLITGKLGDVMQESIQAAMSVVRARSRALGIPADFYQNHDFHIHVPEGATPKDGPSAGIGMATALVSALTNIPVHATVAMTGEITLRGEVLPIGGLKEKLLAAHRGGISTVLIPAENEKDLQEIPKNVRDALTIKVVRWIDEVLAIALESSPTPLPPESGGDVLVGVVPGKGSSEDKAMAH